MGLPSSTVAVVCLALLALGVVLIGVVAGGIVWGMNDHDARTGIKLLWLLAVVTWRNCFRS